MQVRRQAEVVVGRIFSGEGEEVRREEAELVQAHQAVHVHPAVLPAERLPRRFDCGRGERRLTGESNDELAEHDARLQPRQPSNELTGD